MHLRINAEINREAFAGRNCCKMLPGSSIPSSWRQRGACLKKKGEQVLQQSPHECKLKSFMLTRVL